MCCTHVAQSVFHTAYWNPKTKTYGNGQQAALVYPLYLGALPDTSDVHTHALKIQ